MVWPAWKTSASDSGDDSDTHLKGATGRDEKSKWTGQTRPARAPGPDGETGIEAVDAALVSLAPSPLPVCHLPVCLSLAPCPSLTPLRACTRTHTRTHARTHTRALAPHRAAVSRCDRARTAGSRSGPVIWAHCPTVPSCHQQRKTSTFLEPSCGSLTATQLSEHEGTQDGISSAG